MNAENECKRIATPNQAPPCRTGGEDGRSRREYVSDLLALSNFESLQVAKADRKKLVRATRNRWKELELPCPTENQLHLDLTRCSRGDDPCQNPACAVCWRRIRRRLITIVPRAFRKFRGTHGWRPAQSVLITVVNPEWRTEVNEPPNVADVRRAFEAELSKIGLGTLPLLGAIEPELNLDTRPDEEAFLQWHVHVLAQLPPASDLRTVRRELAANIRKDSIVRRPVDISPANSAAGAIGYLTKPRIQQVLHLATGRRKKVQRDDADWLRAMTTLGTLSIDDRLFVRGLKIKLGLI